MRKLFVSVFLIAGIVANVNAAPRAGGTSARGGATSATPSATSGGATVGRSAVKARSATPAASVKAATPSQSTMTVAARSATSQQKTVSAARAATTQKVINSGTKIAGATKNTAVNEACQEKYFGCMDAFCMLENTNGGRCMCSDRNAELDEVLAEIERLDQQSYQMATFGVEQIEMGENADAAIAKANAVADDAMGNISRSSDNNKKKARAALDLSMWDHPIDLDDDDVFSESAMSMNYDITGKTGDELHNVASKLCVAQIPECSAEASMLQLIYVQKVKSDCSAYENSLKQQKNASQNKLSAAQKALREAALEQMQNANKYDLGQCTIQFKKCMQTTGGCGEDFASCAVVSAMDNTNTNKSSSKKAKNYSIQGAVSTIEISASTYDTLLAKKPLCEGITKSCASVADQVWDTFLREIAPTIKSAEIIAEDNARQDCIGTIASCFQKACKDTIDPNDPEGSYDMCLTQPGAMLNVCKIPLNACGIDATSVAKAEKSDVWNYVVARLASMRVDSCTKSVKSCLQSEDRCGKDYGKCVGLDMDTIVAMCPTEKLVGCQENGKKKSLAELSDLVMGIFLDIDNQMLTQCQNAVTTKMLEVCGATDTCVAFDDDDVIGTDSLMSYKDSDGNYVIEGLVSFGNVKISETSEESDPDDVKFGRYEVNIADYKSHLNDTNATVGRVVSSLQSAANKINQKIAILSQDSQIKMCIEGRDMSQIRTRADGATSRTTARYPNLLDSSIMAIINSGLERANQNYTKKYKKLVSEAMDAQDSEMKSVLCAAMASSSPSCVEYAATENGGSVCVKYETNNFDNVFTATDKSGRSIGSENAYATRYVISGASMEKLALVQQSGHSEYTQMDDYGNMLGRIVMAASYSPGDKTCTVTTESTMCKEAEAVVTTDREVSCKHGGVTIFGSANCRGFGGILNIGGGKRTTKITQDYHGTSCKEFGEPVVTSNVIEM